MAYGYLASMKTKSGHRDEVVAILLSGVQGLREAGCQLYIIGVPADDEVTIVVSEVWPSKDQHDAALQFPAAKAAIATAMLTGEFTGQEVDVVGGLGV